MAVISNSSMFIEPDSPLYETATEENGINKPIQVHHVASNKNAPQIIAVVQSGNLYVYAVGNPVMYADEDGEMAKLVKAAIHGLLSGVISSINTETDDFGDYAINFALGFAQGFISDYFDLGVILVGLWWGHTVFVV